MTDNGTDLHLAAEKQWDAAESAWWKGHYASARSLFRNAADLELRAAERCFIEGRTNWGLRLLSSAAALYHHGLSFRAVAHLVACCRAACSTPTRDDVLAKMQELMEAGRSVELCARGWPTASSRGAWSEAYASLNEWEQEAVIVLLTGIGVVPRVDTRHMEERGSAVVEVAGH